MSFCLREDRNNPKWRFIYFLSTSDPEELHYNASLYEAQNLKNDSGLGPQIIYKYNIKNEGPFAVDEAHISIMWPYQTLTGNETQ